MHRMKSNIHYKLWYAIIINTAGMSETLVLGKENATWLITSKECHIYFGHGNLKSYPALIWDKISHWHINNVYTSLNRPLIPRCIIVSCWLGLWHVLLIWWGDVPTTAVRSGICRSCCHSGYSRLQLKLRSATS